MHSYHMFVKKWAEEKKKIVRRTPVLGKFRLQCLFDIPKEPTENKHFAHRFGSCAAVILVFKFEKSRGAPFG